MLTKSVRFILSLAIPALLFFVVKDFKQQDEMDKYIEDYKKFQQQADSAVKFADSLKVQIVVETNEAKAAETRAAQLAGDVRVLKNKTQNLRTHVDTIRLTITDSVELARKIIPLQDSIIAHQDTTIKTQDAQITELQTALTKKDNAISLLTVSRDSLQKVILNIPQAPKNPNKFMGIPLPSRTVTGIMGFVLGAVTVTVLHK